MIYLIKIIIIFFSSTLLNATEIENKIIFKLKNNIYTNYDLELRIRYFKIINNIKELDNNLNNEEILKDYISALIFYEYNSKYNKINNNLSNEVDEFFVNNILKNSIKIKKEETLNIKNNIKIDLIRKKIIESILNSKIEIIKKKSNNLDILYNYNVNYLIIEKSKINNYDLKTIKNRSDFLIFKNYLKENKINYFYKNEDINNSLIVSKNIKKQITNNVKTQIIDNTKYIQIISIEKELESYEGIFVKLINFKTNTKIQKKNLNCSYLNNKEEKIIYKEYEYIKLNNEIKNNLKSINDYIVFKDQETNNYIFLCELRFDEEILNTLNFNKKINTLAKKIQNNFMKNYKNEFNLELTNE